MNKEAQFEEALKALQAKGLLPTEMSSAQIKQIAAAVRRQSVFSATTTQAWYLDRIKDVVTSVVQPQVVERTDEDGTKRMVTEGFNPATAREALRDLLVKSGYQAKDGEEGTIKDLAANARINLVVKTNTQLAQGAGSLIKANADPEVVDEYPAMELVRFEDRKVPRDWEQRWRIAAAVAGDAEAAACLELNGRMCALKSSDIWDELGAGAGGYTDGLDNPFPPFAFNSGMWWQEVSRADAVDLGLMDDGDQAEPAKLDLKTLFAQ